MTTDGRGWIAALPGALAAQRALLDGLLDLSEADEDIRWLAVGCSVGRGAADALSDLDTGIGVREQAFDAAADRVVAGLDRLGPLVESFRHQMPEITVRHERIFAQYADRTQIDLVVFLASADLRANPHNVFLYDADRGAAGAVPPSPPGPVTPQLAREWAFLGWCALADLGKYLRRGSAWEAFERLHDARHQLWRLWALALDVRDPQYGVVSVLDFAAGQVPPEMASTLSDLDPGHLLAAGRRLAALLTEAGHRLPPGLCAGLPDAMARYVTADLASLAAP